MHTYQKTKSRIRITCWPCNYHAIAHLPKTLLTHSMGIATKNTRKGVLTLVSVETRQRRNTFSQASELALLSSTEPSGSSLCRNPRIVHSRNKYTPQKTGSSLHYASTTDTRVTSSVHCDETNTVQVALQCRLATKRCSYSKIGNDRWTVGNRGECSLIAHLMLLLEESTAELPHAPWIRAHSVAITRVAPSYALRSSGSFSRAPLAYSAM